MNTHRLHACLFALAATLPAHAALGAVLRYRCLNPVSGARWTLRIDLAAGRVDGARASIDAHTITWTDPTDGARARLDRHSGQLTLVRASSTGGWVQQAACRRLPAP